VFSVVGVCAATGCGMGVGESEIGIECGESNSTNGEM